MNSSTKATCDWCLQEARVQTIDEKLWRFWIIISTEDPIVTSHKNICDKCKSRYKRFSIYIERCKINTYKIDELLSVGQLKDEPFVDIEYRPLLKTDTSNEVDLDCPELSSGLFIEQQLLTGCSNFPMKSNDSMIDKILSAGKVKEKPISDIEDYLMNEGDVWKEESSDPDYRTASGSNGLVLPVVLEREVLPDSVVLQKKLNNNLICTYCGKTFNYPYKLNIHLSTHTGKKPFKCSHCNKRFTHLPSLKAHLCIHTGEKPYKCSHCSKSFTQMSSLNRHLRTHTGEKLFECSQCNKSYIQLCHLNVHLLTHSGEKPFKCSHCNKSFTRLNSLNRHLHTHTGEKPFKCSHCNKSFTRLSSLNRHLRTHTGENLFECSHCNKSYTQLCHLNDHLLSHSGEKPFKCSHCNKSFTRLNTLNRHLRVHTDDK